MMKKDKLQFYALLSSPWVIFRLCKRLECSWRRVRVWCSMVSKSIIWWCSGTLSAVRLGLDLQCSVTCCHFPNPQGFRTVNRRVRQIRIQSNSLDIPVRTLVVWWIGFLGGKWNMPSLDSGRLPDLATLETTNRDAQLPFSPLSWRCRISLRLTTARNMHSRVLKTTRISICARSCSFVISLIWKVGLSRLFENWCAEAYTT